MKESEKIAKKALEEKGWTVVKNGAPDFLCIKRNSKKIGVLNKSSIKDVLFVEVKGTRKDKDGENLLSKEQKIWKNVIQEKFGKSKYELFEVPLSSLDKKRCCVCEKEIKQYKKTGRPILYCEECSKKKKKEQDKYRQKQIRTLGTTNIDEFSYENFWKQPEKTFEMIEREKRTLGLEEKKCSNGENHKFKIDKSSGAVYCIKCGFIIETNEVVYDDEFDNTHIEQTKISPSFGGDQNDWNR